MELSLISYHKDIYPIGGFFIEGSNLTGWLEVLEAFRLDPMKMELHALPSETANQLWGCLVLADVSLLPKELGKYQSAHIIGERLIIPEKSNVIPELVPADFEQLFKRDIYVLHPDFGLFKLSKPLSLVKYLKEGERTIIDSVRPKDYTVISPTIKAFRIEATPKEQLKQEIESSNKRERIKNKPLTIGERIRLELYKKFLITEENKEGEVGLNLNGSTLERLAKKLNVTGPDSNELILEDFKNLQERNKKEVDKLLDLMKNDPEEALRFAIPLEDHGYTRGGMESEFKMQDRGADFSLFGLFLPINKTGGGTVNLGDEYYRLRDQYMESANKLKQDGNYEKAAFIYLKLLKDYKAAADTLREGKDYEKAALLYLEYVKNEQLAAECYEEGKIYDKAIELYQKLDKLEKVGDLYNLLGNKTSANIAYQAQIDKDIKANKYVKASNISKEKLQHLFYAQELLLMGWKSNTNQYNCLRTYLNNIEDAEEVWAQIEKIKRENVNSSNDTIFLRVLKEEYSNQDENEKKIKDLAYILISDLLEQGRISSNELVAFNKEDARLRADIMRYEVKKNKRLIN